jgi:exopolysaccharide biosynthesis polyprenyl glycosylphosphotransferase
MSVADDTVVSPRVSPVYLSVKRLMDIVGAGLGLVLLSPLFAAIAVAIKLDSPGPVLFTQMRAGKGGKPFRFYKFRSMRADAERLRKSLDHMNQASGPVFKLRDDPRITRVGAVLRRFSLDELPQLFNVLKGDMSLVGPRPPLLEEVARYEPRHLRRLAVTPGITCIWQVSGRSDIPFERWVEMDVEYIQNRSLLLDLKLLLLTIPAVLSGRGAY